MKIQRPKFSPNIDADIAIGVIDRNFRALIDSNASLETSFVFNGVHERTAKGDEVSLTVTSTSKRSAIKYHLKRDSLYHILLEYLFHPLDRYADSDGDKDVFLEKRAAQKRIESDAKEYFYPYDKILNDIRIRFQQYLNDKILDNETFIIDFIIENENINKDNPFIRACLPSILLLRSNRGSESLITLALKKTFGHNLCELNRQHIEYTISIEPDSCHICLNDSIDDLFCGDSFMDWIELISIRFQTKILSEIEIDRLNRELREFESFFKYWFLGDSQMIKIEFGDYEKQPLISDDVADGLLFLNYNAQLLIS